MTPKFMQFLCAAALLAPATLFGQTTATTVPVGYVSLTVPANSDSTIGQPMHRTPAFAATGTVAGNTVTVSGGMVVDQFVYAPPAQTNSYYLLVKTAGAFNGRYFEVTDNTMTTLTLESDIQALGSPTTISFEVIPYHTLNTLFPGGQGVGVSTDIFEPVGLVQFRSLATGVNRPIAESYFYYQGTEEAGTGWYSINLSLGLQDHATVDPYVAVRIRNFEAVPKTVILSGIVPSYSVKTPIVTANVRNDNYLSIQYPVDLTLEQSGLAGNGVTASTDIFEPVDFLMVYNDAATGRNKPILKSYFYYTGIEEAGTGWYDSSNISLGLQNNAAVFQAGRTFVIRKSAGAPSTVQASTTLPYTP